MNAQRILAVAALVLVGCGGSQSPAAPPPRPRPAPAAIAPKPIATAPAARAPLFVEYVVIRESWVEEVMPADAAAMQAWATENGLAGDVLWQILITTSKKDADAVLARLKNGAPFARLAREASADPVAAPKGGYYLASQVIGLSPEVRAAFAKLKPGETAAAPVKAADGWHIVRKAPLGADELEPLYRKAEAPELTSKLANELRSRLGAGAEMRPAIADSVSAVLGDRAESDERRPAPATVERDELRSTRLPDAAKSALSQFADTARGGDIMADAVVAGGEVIVARAAR